MALRMAMAVVAALALTAPAARGSEPLDDAGYLAFADRVANGLEIRWDEALGAYVSRDKGATARTNANMLLVHAAAAAAAHTGAARHDDRARRIVERMTATPMLAITRRWLPRNRSRCWRKRLDGGPRDHASVDSQVAEALEWAWRARAELQLPPELAEAAARVVRDCALVPQWRFPHALKNQINWNAQLGAAVARMTGDARLLRADYRRHLARFLRGVPRPLRGMPTTNLGEGFGFHYSPELDEHRPTNFDTPEYAHIVVTTLLYHREAVAAGMRPLPAADLERLTRWTTRLLLGNWTHAGYLNWDTGHGLHRLHSGQYWAWSMQGLLTIASAPEFAARPEYPAWAKSLFDRGLRLYARWADEAGTAIAPQLPFDMVSAHRDHDLYASRMAANAMRAIRLGLGGARSVDPPAFYAYDRELQRLAVTTPSYSTAIVPRTHDAFQYGGIELARLLGPRGAVAATTGGVAPASFGVLVRDAADRVVLSSQPGRPRGASLRLARGRVGTGSFRALTAVGRIRAGRLRVTSTYTFRPRTIDVTWQVRCAGGCARHDVDVVFPTWGETAAVTASGSDGVVALSGPGTRPVPLEGVGRIELGASPESGY
ncbi:MAG TPA: hypothetical protein VD836_09560, partial [Solirubrobacteraceae bacterium]|nr:hypothetical protein [Solirubrobacteraceae bacterium]